MRLLMTTCAAVAILTATACSTSKEAAPVSYSPTVSPSLASAQFRSKDDADTAAYIPNDNCYGKNAESSQALVGNITGGTRYSCGPNVAVPVAQTASIVTTAPVTTTTSTTAPQRTYTSGSTTTYSPSTTSTPTRTYTQPTTSTSRTYTTTAPSTSQTTTTTTTRQPTVTRSYSDPLQGEPNTSSRSVYVIDRPTATTTVPSSSNPSVSTRTTTVPSVETPTVSVPSVEVPSVEVPAVTVPTPEVPSVTIEPDVGSGS